MAYKYIEKKEMNAVLRKMMAIIIESSGGISGNDPLEMPQCLFRYYMENAKGEGIKPVYDLVADSFLSLKAFCLLMGNGCWTQAAGVLRTALEQVSTSVVLLGDESARQRYMALQEERRAYILLSEKDQKEFLKAKNAKGKEKIYFDYSWFGSDYGRNQILEAAHLKEFIVDIEETLNGFSHGNISAFQLHDERGDWKLMGRHGRRMVLTCCKLFDFLVCATSKYIGEEFLKWNICVRFPDFKKTYLAVMDAKTMDA